MVHLLPEALQDLMTARNLNLFLLAIRMTSAGAARRDAIFDVIGMEVNAKVVKGFGVGKILQLLRKVVRETLEILDKMWRDSDAARAGEKSRLREERAWLLYRYEFTGLDRRPCPSGRQTICS
jgi:hypothetical protein